MASAELDIPDLPACLLLGLAGDRRTRYTFPHPAHRCHAKGSPAVVEPRHQAMYCLSLGFSTCDRYRVWQRTADR